MRYLLDTNSCLYLMTGAHPALTAKVAECESGSIGISAVAFAELVLGSANGKAPSMGVVEDMISELPVVAFDEAAARAYAMLPFKRGRFDRLLAAHALSLGAVVVTRNRSDFADVPGLGVEDWTVA